MENRKLDAIDLRILSELQANGRITNVELSRRAKITAPPCLRRMRALEVLLLRETRKKKMLRQFLPNHPLPPRAIPPGW